MAAVKAVPRGRAPGRGSIMWDTLTDLAHFPLMLPIATMQSALPAVGTAVNRYGIYKSDPQARGRRTNWSMIRFLYDGGDFAQREATDLHDELAYAVLLHRVAHLPVALRAENPSRPV